jgi:signal peptidase I
MRNLLKFLLTLTVALLLMMAFRALAFTIYSVDGDGLEPEFVKGDRVMVNRWSYGLRTGGNRLFSYGRFCRQPMKRGDIVAYECPTGKGHYRVLFGRLCALPGDTVRYNGEVGLVPGLVNCADADYYWVQSLNEKNPTDSRQLGFISEQRIIGRAFLVVYSHATDSSLLSGYRSERFLLPK